MNTMQKHKAFSNVMLEPSWVVTMKSEVLNVHTYKIHYTIQAKE